MEVSLRSTNLNRSTVLIFSSDASFARQITANWPDGADSPEFVQLKEDLCPDLPAGDCDLAIADAGSQPESLSKKFVQARKPAIVIHSDSNLPGFAANKSVLLLRRDVENWPVLVGFLGGEILQRRRAENCAQESEHARVAAENDATLGRYMVEMRHSVNNALTTVLGNAELLVLEPGLPAHVLSQADMLRNMALRLHEIFQRFSSIEKELKVASRGIGRVSAQLHSHNAATAS
jgi:signal transduction histidine kinase